MGVNTPEEIKIVNKKRGWDRDGVSSKTIFKLQNIQLA